MLYLIPRKSLVPGYRLHMKHKQFEQVCDYKKYFRELVEVSGEEFHEKKSLALNLWYKLIHNEETYLILNY